jgi:hypothetical protein
MDPVRGTDAGPPSMRGWSATCLVVGTEGGAQANAPRAVEMLGIEGAGADSAGPRGLGGHGFDGEPGAEEQAPVDDAAGDGDGGYGESLRVPAGRDALPRRTVHGSNRAAGIAP